MTWNQVESTAYSYILGARTRRSTAFLIPVCGTREARTRARAAKLKRTHDGAGRESLSRARPSDTRLVEGRPQVRGDRLRGTNGSAAKDIA